MSAAAIELRQALVVDAGGKVGAAVEPPVEHAAGRVDHRRAAVAAMHADDVRAELGEQLGGHPARPVADVDDAHAGQRSTTVEHPHGRRSYHATVRASWVVAFGVPSRAME